MEMLPDRSVVVSAGAAALLSATVLSATLLTSAEDAVFAASAAVSLLPQFLKYLHLSNKQYVSIYILSFMFLFVKVSSFIPEIQISNRDYSGYVDTNFANQSASSLGFFISTLKNILFLTILVKSRLFEKYALWSNLTFLTLVFLNVGYSVPLIGRINMYFVFFSTVMLAIVFANRNEYKNTNNIIMQLLILIVLVMSVYGYVSTANKLLPYNFYWETPDYSKYLKF